MKLHALHTVFLLVVLLVVFSNAPPNFSLVSYLPASWSSMCKVSTNSSDDVNATISCNVTPDDATQWRLADLRTALEPVVSAGRFEVSVKIVCKTGGNISLPWPMRCPGLVRLTVYNCRLLDKFGDFDTPAMQLGDWLRELDMRSCAWINKPESLDQMLHNILDITSHYECGQDSTLEVYIYRNNVDELDVQNTLHSFGDDFDTSALANLHGDGDGRSGLLNRTVDLGDLGGLLNGTFDLGSILNGSGGLGDLGIPGTGNDAAGGKEGSPSGPSKFSSRQVNSTGPAADVLDSLTSPDNLFNECLFERLEVLDESAGSECHLWMDESIRVHVIGTLCDQPVEGDTRTPHLCDQLMDDSIRKRVIGILCDQLVDRSGGVLFSKHYFEFMVKNSMFPRLRTMNYSYIGLTDMPRELREWRRFFPQLQILDMSHNYVQKVDDFVPDNSGVPLTLLLQHNNITTITMDMFREWARVPDFHLDIRNNPLACGCELGQFLEAFHDDSQWTGRVLGRYRTDVSELMCATPPELSGRALKSLQRSDLPCPVQDLRVIISVPAVVVVLLLLLLAVRYRREVRILVLTRVHSLLPCGMSHVLGGGAPDKQYDAFVAYAHQDSEWVVGQLMPQLETPSRRACGPFKLCIHQRDFIVGKPIIDNIIDCIAASRHTIVVLSKSFVTSAWAVEELRQAYQQSLQERRRHLVLVVLEDVPQTDMPPLLRRCCKIFTYLHVSNTIFWDRLTHSIHVSGKNVTKRKENKEGDASDNEYINIVSNETTEADVEEGLEPSTEPVSRTERLMFQRSASLETVRMLQSSVPENGVSNGAFSDRGLVVSTH